MGKVPNHLEAVISGSNVRKSEDNPEEKVVVTLYIVKKEFFLSLVEHHDDAVAKALGETVLCLIRAHVAGHSGKHGSGSTD
jgi:hypothetical protein